MTAKRWEHRLWDCQQQAAQLVADKESLLAAIEKAWRTLDTGDAYGKDATQVMLDLQGIHMFHKPQSPKANAGES